MILFRAKKIIFMICFAFLFFTSFVAAEQKEQDINKQYENIVKSIKDNPQQAIKDLKKLADKNNSAAIEYLILLSIYEPQKVNTPEFEKIAHRLHTDVMAQYEKVVPDSPFYRMYQHKNEELIKNDYMKCYKDLSCLIEVGVFNFSKFFNIWSQQSTNMRYVPWKIVVPCKTAQKLHLTAILDSAGGGHGAETLDISDCSQYPQYEFPADVEEYYNYIQRELEFYNPGSIRYYYMAKNIYENILSHYDPDWNFERRYYPDQKYLQALPLEAWAMESYPNYKYFDEVIKHGIGFNQAVEKLTKHYVKTFQVPEEKASSYARYTMIPMAAQSSVVDKNTLRYKIFSGVPVQEIKTWIENKKIKGEVFAEPKTPHQKDEILMVSIHRPDVLKMLIETCPNNEEKLGCGGLNMDIDAENAFGKTALMYAAQYGFMDSVKILLEAGADINAQTKKGNLDDNNCWDICIANGERTALMYAVQEGHLDIAKYLVEKGADINLKDSKGMSVYDYLSGKAPYLGNIKRAPTSIENDFYPPKKYENKNVTSEQAQEFVEFLDNHAKVQ